MNFDNPFTSEIIWYTAYVAVLLLLFGCWGYFSPWINAWTKAKTNDKVEEVFGQVFWRFFKAFAIAIGAFGLLGSFTGLEKLLDDTFKPQLEAYLRRDMSNYEEVVAKIIAKKCEEVPYDQSFCASMPIVLQFVSQGAIDRKHGVNLIQNKISTLPPDPLNQQAKYLAARMGPAISMVSQNSSFDPVARLTYGIVSVYLLAFALAVSFGEAVFQYKVEKKRAPKGMSYYDWLTS